MTKSKHKDWITVTVLFWILIVSIARNGAQAQEEKVDEARPLVSRIVIDVQGIGGDVDRWVELVKTLIFFQEGDPFSTKRFQDSIETLKSLSKFSTSQALI